MIVVVEGPDGSGKSTLIDNLRLTCSRHFVSLRRSGPPKNADELTSIIRWMTRMEVSLVPLICDRYPLISEPIYGNAIRGTNLLDGIYDVDAQKAIFKSVDRVIYCRPPTSVIYHKIHANPQLKGVVEKIEEITQNYDHVMKLLAHWGVHVTWYDWTAHGNILLDAMFFGSKHV